MAYENKSVNKIELQEGGRLLLFEVGNLGFTVGVKIFQEMVKGSSSVPVILNNIAAYLYLNGFDLEDCNDPDRIMAALQNKSFKF